MIICGYHLQKTSFCPVFRANANYEKKLNKIFLDIDKLSKDMYRHKKALIPERIRAFLKYLNVFACMKIIF